jgi:hypothetical protein
VGLKKLITSLLLPAGYREQVLGDLQERGFRMGDAAGVLPRVWWSHARRSFIVPNLAGASDDIIERRTRSLEASRLRWANIWMTAVAATTWFDASRGEIGRWFWVFCALALLVATGFKIFYPSARSPEPAADRHRRVLTQLRESVRFGVVYFPVVFAASRFSRAMWEREAPRPLEIAALALCFLYGRYRASRLQKELHSLA